MFRFSWWRDQNNRDGAKAIIDILKVVVPAVLVAAVAVAGYLGFVREGAPSAGAAPEAPAAVECNSSFTQTGDGALVQTCGDGDVQIDGNDQGDTITCNSRFRQDGAGNLIQNCGDGTVIVGLTEDRFFNELSKREAQIRSELERVANAESRALAAEKRLLEHELGQVLRKMADIDQAYQETVADLQRLQEELARFRSSVPEDQLAAAQQALFQGDRAQADALLEALEGTVAETVRLAADAAFLRGEIAEQEIRWHAAAAHYDRAARLDPTFDRLLKARLFALRAGDYALSVRYGEDLVRLARAEGTPEDLATALNELAYALEFVERYAEGEALIREALEIDKATIGPHSAGYATGLLNLGLAVAYQDRLTEAEGHLREALKISAATNGPDDPEHAHFLHNLAWVLEEQGRFGEAEPLYRSAVRISATLGPQHPDYALSLMGLGGLLVATGNRGEARGLLEQALAILAGTLGPEHPDTRFAQAQVDAVRAGQ